MEFNKLLLLLLLLFHLTVNEFLPSVIVVPVILYMIYIYISHTISHHAQTKHSR
jgi:hypothetical protein